jgi:hypothetical protein
MLVTHSNFGPGNQLQCWLPIQIPGNLAHPSYLTLGIIENLKGMLGFNNRKFSSIVSLDRFDFRKVLKKMAPCCMSHN